MRRILKLGERVIQHGKFIPQLDGLRFVAIISVVLFHANGRMMSRFGMELQPVSEFLSTGFFGVQIFFAISGFILAYQYWRKQDQFKYKEYFIRRIRRIEPPFLVAILLQTLVLSLWFKPELSKEYWKSFVNVITYTSNFTQNNIINGVTWSLEVEVQFYLLLPLLLLLIHKARKIIHPVISLIILTIGCIMVSSQIKYTSLVHYFPYFSVGIITAWVKSHKPNIPIPRLNKVFTAIGLLALFAVNLDYFDFLGGFRIIILLGLMLMIFMSVLVSETGLGFLSNKAIAVVGGMCYTIYLYHIMALSFFSNLISPILNDIIPSEPLSYTINVLLMTMSSIAISYPLYLLLEKPFMYRKWSVKFFKNTNNQIKED